MKFIQVPKNSFVRERTIVIDPSTLAQITSDDSTNYTLTLSLQLARNSVSDRTYLKISLWDESVIISSQKIKTLPLPTLVNPASLTSGVIRTSPPAYPSSVNARLRGGVSMIEKLVNPPLPLISKIISRSDLSFLTNSEEIYSYGVLTPTVATAQKSEKKSYFEPTSLLHKIVKERVIPTQYTSHPHLSQLNSSTPVERSLQQYNKEGGSPLLYEIAKYTIEGINPHPRESEFISYSASRADGKLLNIPVTTTLSVNKEWEGKSLILRLELFNENSSPDEIENIPLPISSLVESYFSSYSPPSLSITTTQETYTLSIADKELPGVFFAWNIYMKSILRDGSVGVYRKIGSTKNSSFSTFTGKLSENLSVLRVVPVTRQNKESNIFSDIVIGNGYDDFGNLTIVVYNTPQGVYVDTYGLPKRGMCLTIFSRDCTDNPENPFKPVERIYLAGDENHTSHFISQQTDRIYEFYASCNYLNPYTCGEEITTSNYVMCNSRKVVSENSISVQISKERRSGNDCFFTLTTLVTPTENERITTFLKAQVPELYEQYLSPANNLSSPLGGDVKGVPNYLDLFFHEVVRTNLNTSEREVFSLVGDGEFSDSPTTRILSHMKDLEPTHEYIYQVFTYRKNPLELFKRLVASGKNSVTGKDWFYLPYKWRNRKSLGGTLYPDDENGIPIIDSFESFTSTSYGETCTLRITGASNGTSLRNQTATRTDRTTVRISWDIEAGTASLYESFLVMKVVNGVRSTLGRTCKNYIYHWVKPADVGTMYYIVIPVMMEWDLGTSVYTDAILIDCEGIIEKVRVNSV